MPLTLADLRLEARPTGLILLVGALGAALAVWLGTPLPFLLGALITVGAWSIWRSAGVPETAPRPVLQVLRKASVSLIGVMIGATFSPSLLEQLPQLWLSVLAVVPFVLITHGLSFLIYRRLAKLDRVTAFFAAMPGGLIEAVTLGEAAGADPRLLSTQHFARVVLVIIAVPTVYYLMTGIVVGSAAGQSFDATNAGLLDLAELALLCVIGVFIGRKFRLPASYMIGPMLLSAIAHGTGFLDVASPVWLLAGAQLVIGAGLGVLFAGSSLRSLARAFGFGCVSVAVMLSVAVGFAALLAPWSSLPLIALIISLAPGGVTEMGLVALSLGISPVAVTVHHLFRITLAVSIAGWALPRLRD
ncbi:AbrB family transcriptional regulator [Pseudosulfitobacter koreensis]|uniref:AbrB family transcriptional regulator n=1 Tax=Pseudosulfitobacter koreensis TaxID=2968472 RepID=A0ABT1YVW2_9RHOB|nr:AbrB family transcriptional regulator [Pseudosulfitobacter koreense]MCR8825025.1 AbrB family transcriptional regulator [Pseudosulfitobacter koreense]